jgi:ribosomal protein S18 acetylase RimI-like enzyme
VRSLGYRTDLMIRAYEGSQIADHGDYLAVRSPENPMFWWGNFLLLPGLPGPGETALWLSRFAAEFPDARHVALGIDDPEARPEDAAELLAAGMNLQHSTVMAAVTVHDPPRPNHAATYRRFSGDSDWRQAGELTAACYGEDDRAFIESRVSAVRALTEAGRGSWFGAFADGRLLAQLGLLDDGSGTARYQSVETHPDARRQGLAGTLVCHAARHGLGAAGASTLVMVADPGDVAIRVYRSVGFEEVETQLGFERPPAADSTG